MSFLPYYKEDVYILAVTILFYVWFQKNPWIIDEVSLEVSFQNVIDIGRIFWKVPILRFVRN